MKINIPGIPVPVTVVDEERAQQANFVVCITADIPTSFTDNVQTTCCDCGTAIVHRPHMPAEVPKICMGCMVLRAKGGTA
jgi:hypothetical protein